MSKSKASKFHTDLGSGVMGTLSETLPDERPITALQVVENSGKCPPGYWPILKTYDEDSDADLWRQPILFGKRTCRYLCISKSEGVTGRTVSALRIISSSDPPPAGFSSLPLTADSKARGWRRRQLCYLLAPRPATGPLTDIILCSRLKKAPDGFQYAGEINGVMVCFKVGGSSSNNSPVHLLGPSNNILSSPLRSEDTNGDTNYENVTNGHHFPDKRMARPPPERPPKTAALVAELNRLNLQDNKKSPSSSKKQYPKLTESPSNHDYEALSISYQPVRPAPPPPRTAPAPPVPQRSSPPKSSCSSHTLSGWSGVEGVPFVLNAKLGGFSSQYMTQFPVIKRRSLLQLDQEFPYTFMVERQT